VSSGSATAHRGGLLLDRGRASGNLKEAVLNELVKLRGVGLLSRADCIPECHDLLTADDVGKRTEVLHLRKRQLVVLAKIANLLNETKDPLCGHLDNLGLKLLPAVDDVFSSDDVVVLLDEVDKGNRSCDANVAHADCIEARRHARKFAASKVVWAHTGIGESLEHPCPGALRRGNRSALNGLGGPEMLGVVADEVNGKLVDAFGSCPVNPVFDSRDKVVGDEAIKEGRVHLVDGVFRGIVDCRHDQGVGVEAHAFHFAVKDKLECRVLDTWRCTVDLIEEEDARLGASRVQPVRRSKGGDTSFLDAVVIGDTDEVAFGEERQADIEEALAGCPGAFSGNGRLANAVRTAKQEGVLDEGEDDCEGLEVDGVRSRHLRFLGLVNQEEVSSLCTYYNMPLGHLHGFSRTRPGRMLQQRQWYRAGCRWLPGGLGAFRSQ